MNFLQYDGQCFQRFINQLSQEFSDSINFLQLDNGSFHKNVDLKEFIIPIFPPPHSRELNPIESFLQQLKRELQWENFQNLQRISVKKRLKSNNKGVKPRKYKW